MKDLILKHRPETFDECWTSRGAVSQILAYLRTDTVPVGLILSGTYGIGKTTLARLISSSLACLKPKNENPCHACKGCELVDLWWMGFGGRWTVNCGADSLDALFNFCSELRYMRASLDRRRYTFVLDEAHKLSDPAQARILPRLESTPNSTFIFCTTRTDQMSGGILARSQIIELGPPEPQEVQAALMRIAQQEGIKLSNEEALTIAKEAHCVPRDCLKALENLHALASMPEAQRPPSTKSRRRLP